MRYRREARGGDNRFLHTLNATACAVPRTMLAVLETHQQEDGSVVIPLCLRPFMGGRDRLVPAVSPSKAATTGTAGRHPVLPASELYTLPSEVVLS